MVVSVARDGSTAYVPQRHRIQAGRPAPGAAETMGEFERAGEALG